MRIRDEIKDVATRIRGDWSQAQFMGGRGPEERIIILRQHPARAAKEHAALRQPRQDAGTHGAIGEAATATPLRQTWAGAGARHRARADRNTRPGATGTERGNGLSWTGGSGIRAQRPRTRRHGIEE